MKLFGLVLVNNTFVKSLQAEIEYLKYDKKCNEKILEDLHGEIVAEKQKTFNAERQLANEQSINKTISEKWVSLKVLISNLDDFIS